MERKDGWERRKYLSTLLNNVVYKGDLKGEAFSAADLPLLYTHLRRLHLGSVLVCFGGLNTY